MPVISRHALQHRRPFWARLVTGAVLAGVFSLTCTPICGSVLDVDSVSCCERHGCVRSPHDATPTVQADCSHSMPASAAGGRCTSIRYDVDRCCQQGRLTYPTAQVRASRLSGSVLLFTVEFVLAVAHVPTQFSQRTRTASLLKLTSNPLYTLHAVFRI